ncbi:hypothetical protein ACN24M_39745 [Streptomyces microflavus]
MGLQVFGEGGGGVGEGGGEGAGVGDAVVEGEDAAEFVVVDGSEDGDLVSGEAEAVGACAAVGGEPVAEVGVLDDGDEDLVVGEEAEVDGVGEGEAPGDGAEEGFVVHGGDGGVAVVGVGVPDAGVAVR